MILHSRKSYALLAAGLGLGACAAQVGPANTELGAVAVALESTGASGSTYRLAGTFVMDDPEATAFMVTEDDTSDDILLSPRVGSYSLELCDGPSSTNTDLCPNVDPWTLYRMECSDGSGASPSECAANGGALNPVPVDGAVLVSENPQATNVQAGQASSVMFAFSVPGDGTVVFARGDVQVDFSVSEGLADGSPCSTDVECQSHVCSDTDPATCQTATCQDGVQNGGETGPDCGGNCTTACSTANDSTTTDPSNPDDTTSGNDTTGSSSTDSTTTGSNSTDPSNPDDTTSGNDTTGSSSADSTTTGSNSTDPATADGTTSSNDTTGSTSADDTTSGSNSTSLLASGAACSTNAECASSFCFVGSCF